MFLWHGGKDDIAPAGEDPRLADDLAARSLGALLDSHVDLQAEHKVTMAASTRGVEFFSRHLIR